MFGIQLLGRGTLEPRTARTQPVIVQRQRSVRPAEITPRVQIGRLVREAIMHVGVEVVSGSYLAFTQHCCDGATLVLCVLAVVVGAAMDS